MGDVTESSMRTDYTILTTIEIPEPDFYGLKQNSDKYVIVYLTPDGILVEVVKEKMEAQSVEEFVIASKEVEIRNQRIVEELTEIIKKGK